MTAQRARRFGAGLVLVALGLPAVVLAGREPVPREALPAEWMRFVPGGQIVIAQARADLNADGREDVLLVLEADREETKGDEPDEMPRRLLILRRDTSGALQLAKQSEQAVLCRQCGGVMGDPFESVEAKKGSFTITHYGGSAWRWASRYQFNYSRRDQTWQLVYAEETSFQAADPEKTQKKSVARPPKQFGKIAIEEFDPYDYRGKGAR